MPRFHPAGNDNRHRGLLPLRLIESATRELEALERYTGEADRFHLRVPRWIVTGNEPVHTFRSNVAVFDKNGAKSAAGAVFQRRSL